MALPLVVGRVTVNLNEEGNPALGAVAGGAMVSIDCVGVGAVESLQAEVTTASNRIVDERRRMIPECSAPRSVWTAGP